MDFGPNVQDNDREEKRKIFREARKELEAMFGKILFAGNNIFATKCFQEPVVINATIKN